MDIETDIIVNLNLYDMKFIREQSELTQKYKYI